jgi:hypothetical protein
MNERFAFTVTLVLAAAFLLPLCAPREKSLWNGRDFDGWAFVLESDSASASDVWSAKDGVIRCVGAPNGYMRTREAHSNYRLHVEWRWPETPGNSGVFLHLAGPDKVWPECVECQLFSGDAGNFVLIGPSARLSAGDSAYAVADRFQSIPRREASSERPAGEWNAYDIVASGDTIRCSVNGVLQNEGFAAFRTAGFIGLQSEGAPIEFRNLRIAPL